MSMNPWPVVAGYEELEAVLRAAYEQATVGKGKERHANDLPFTEQRMIMISELLGSEKGMAYQVVKKLTEGLQFTDPKAREKELLGAIVYIAGILVLQNKAIANGK